MPLATFLASLTGLDPLLSLMREVMAANPAVSYLGLNTTLIGPTLNGTVVLAVARFEQFLRDVGGQAAVQYSRAQPPVPRSALPHALQLKIIGRNFSSAISATRHGRTKTEIQRLQDVTRVVARIHAQEVWGDEAIETAGNPDSVTVRDIFNLFDIGDAWKLIESAFAPLWTSAQSTAALPSIPAARKYLDSVVGWRHSAAHTGNISNVSPGDVETAIVFMGTLAQAIYLVLQRQTDEQVKHAGSTPAIWP